MNTKNIARNLVTGTLLGLSLLVLTGCPDSRAVSNQVITPTGADTSNPARAIATALTYKVIADGPNTDLNRTLASGVESELNRLGYRESRDNPALLIRLDAELSQFDRSGNYYVYRGSSQANVSRGFDGRTVGSDRIRVNGGRELGEEEAKRAATRALVTETSGWIRDNLSTEAIGLAANDVSVTLPWHQNVPFNRRIADYSAKFVQKVGALPGVANVTLVGQDNATRTLTFRVIHDANAFPDGLINQLSRIDDLGITVR